MSKKPEEEIEDKLRELEAVMKESTGSNVPAAIDKSTGLASTTLHISPGKLSKEDEASAAKADWNLLGGSALLLVGLFVLLSHLTVSTAPMWGGFGAFGGFGGGGATGVLVLLLLVGLGFFFYDYKNKIGWMLVICSLVALIFSLFASMHLILAPMSLLSLLFLFLPLVMGGGLLAKGIKMHGQISDRHDSHDK